MKQMILEFIRRGMAASGLGPIVLAVLYLILQHQGILQTLTVHQVCTGIFSLSALAFLAGGMNVVYQIEQLPLMAAISLHGGVLYVGYLAVYLLNDWLEHAIWSILVFTGIFLLGYLAIWVIIYFIIRKNTEQMNEMLKEKHDNTNQA